MPAPLIDLKGITKTYNEGKVNAFEALKGIDLEIESGEFLAIMGPSGSGKSTMMNILGALDVPSSGQYLVKGRDISSFSNNQLAEFRNQEVGFVFQQFNLLPKVSVKENVLLPTLYGNSHDALSRVRSALKKVDLLDKIDNKPNQLSGGEMQRVAIARSLMMKPSIMMADEPTGNLDSKTSDQIMSIFTTLHKEGNTIILITHEDEIAAFAERVVQLKDGLISSTRKK